MGNLERDIWELKQRISFLKAKKSQAELDISMYTISIDQAEKDLKRLEKQEAKSGRT